MVRGIIGPTDPSSQIALIEAMGMNNPLDPALYSGTQVRPDFQPDDPTRKSEQSKDARKKFLHERDTLDSVPLEVKKRIAAEVAAKEDRPRMEAPKLAHPDALQQPQLTQLREEDRQIRYSADQLMHLLHQMSNANNQDRCSDAYNQLYESSRLQLAERRKDLEMYREQLKSKGTSQNSLRLQKVNEAIHFCATAAAATHPGITFIAAAGAAVSLLSLYDPRKAQEITDTLAKNAGWLAEELTDYKIAGDIAKGIVGQGATLAGVGISLATSIYGLGGGDKIQGVKLCTTFMNTVNGAHKTYRQKLNSDIEAKTLKESHKTNRAEDSFKKNTQKQKLAVDAYQQFTRNTMQIQTGALQAKEAMARNLNK